MISDLAVLYSFRRCPYAMRARLALTAAGLHYAHREVQLRSKPPELLIASPKGTVPVLVLPDGAVIAQSLDIMLWALHQNDPHRWLTIRVPMAEMLLLIDENDGEFKAHLDRYKYPNRYADEVNLTGELIGTFTLRHRDAGVVWIEKLERMLAGGYLYGPAASLADMALLPFVRQFAHTHTAWFASRSLPRVQAWLQAFEASALYAAVMEKHPVWQPEPLG